MDSYMYMLFKQCFLYLHVKCAKQNMLKYGNTWWQTISNMS